MTPDTDEQKRLILVVVLAMAVLGIFQYFYSPAPQPQPAPMMAEEGMEDSIAPNIDIPDIAVEPKTREEVIAAAPRLAIQGPKVYGSINLKGARLDDLILRNYRTQLAEDSNNITLLSPSSFSQSFFTEFNWVAADKNLNLPDKNTVWTVVGNDFLTPSQPVTLRYDGGQGVVFEQTFSLDDDYLVTVDQHVINNTGNAVVVYPYGLVSLAGGDVELSAIEDRLVHRGPIGYFNQELQEVDFAELTEDGNRQWQAQGGWLGMTDKYWIAALIPDQSKNITIDFSSKKRLSGDLFQVNFSTEAMTIQANSKGTLTSHVFAGAKELNLLEQYTEELGVPHFDLAVDFGWFYFLTKPFFIALDFLYGLFGNFGVAIILLTVFIKVLFLPLANKSYRSMNRMKELQPRMKELRETYKEDPVRLQQEMMAMYKKEKVNPASGCLPIFVQIPVFFALYKVLYVSIEMRHKPFFGWVQDLSAPDPTSVLNLFGLLPYDSPEMLSFFAIGAWPLLMGFAMFLQQRLNPAPVDKTQAQIFMLMPIVFTFMLANFPAGLVIYWTTNNFLSIAQQRYIRRHDPETMRLAKRNAQREAADKK